MLRTPSVSVYARETSVGGSSVHLAAQRHARRTLALIVYCTGYPLLAFALWLGARNGSWSRASAFVALGVFASFVGWILIGSSEAASEERANGAVHSPSSLGVFLSLYNRAGAIVTLLGSYAVSARAQGWPTPDTFIGWFALVWIPLFAAFAVPVDRASNRFEVSE